MSDKKHYRDRVDVRFDDRFRLNRHREGAEKNGRENCVEHAGGEISILNHMCASRSRSECVYYVTTRSRIDDRREKRKHSRVFLSLRNFPIRILHLTTTNTLLTNKHNRSKKKRECV